MEVDVVTRKIISKGKAPARQATSARGGSTSEFDSTRTRILTVAMQEFADNGLSGSRINQIADAAGANKQLIYYYFGSKEALFVAALEESYRQLREIDAKFVQKEMPAIQALRELVGLTFDYHADHPEFVRMLMAENIHRGSHVRQLPHLRGINKPAITVLEHLCARGVAEGSFREGIDVIYLHLFISAVSFYGVSNQYTFSFVFGRQLEAKSARDARRAAAVDLIERYVRVS